MKSRQKFAILALILTNLCLSLPFTDWAGAAEAPKNISLELPSREEAEGEDRGEILEDKYQEMLQEITISPEAAVVVENIKNVVAELQDLTAEICQTQYKGKRAEETQVVGKLWLAVTPKLVARLELYEPSALRGQIIVVDEEVMQARFYTPVTNQITVQNLKDIGEEALSVLEITDPASFFDFAQFEVIVLESLPQKDSTHYLLQVSGLEGKVQLVRVASDTWLPYEIAEVAEGTLTGKLELKNAVLNQSLDLEFIRNLPDVKEFYL